MENSRLTKEQLDKFCADNTEAINKHCGKQPEFMFNLIISNAADSPSYTQSLSIAGIIDKVTSAQMAATALGELLSRLSISPELFIATMQYAIDNAENRVQIDPEADNENTRA